MMSFSTLFHFHFSFCNISNVCVEQPWGILCSDSFRKVPAERTKEEKKMTFSSPTNHHCFSPPTASTSDMREGESTRGERWREASWEHTSCRLLQISCHNLLLTWSSRATGTHYGQVRRSDEALSPCGLRCVRSDIWHHMSISHFSASVLSGLDIFAPACP